MDGKRDNSVTCFVCGEVLDNFRLFVKHYTDMEQCCCVVAKRIGIGNFTPAGRANSPYESDLLGLDEISEETICACPCGFASNEVEFGEDEYILMEHLNQQERPMAHMLLHWIILNNKRDQ